MRRLSGSILCAFTLATLTVSGCHQEPTAPQEVGPITLLVVSGGGQTGVVGTELPQPLVVKANNASGLPIPFLTVNFVVTSGSGNMFADAVTTDPRGIAADYWTLGTVAGQSQHVEVRAVLSNGQKQVYGAFTATALAGPAAQIAVQAGNNQSATVGTALAMPPSVIVSDQFNNPVSGVAVTFAVASGGGSLSGGSQVTNAAGTATVGSWKLGTAPGLNTLTATASGSGVTGNPVTFNATGLPVGVTFAIIVGGDDDTCGLTPAGVAYCWGFNGSGELGDGTTTTRLLPTAVTGDLRFATITSGDLYHCGLTLAGAAFCWGNNSFGQLGDGTTTDALTPGAVASGLTFTNIVAGSEHTCGLTSAGAAYCWGGNNVGQLGDGTTTDRLTPVAVTGGLTFVSMTASGDGGGHTCGLTSAGAAYCWGSNGVGDLGDGTTTNRLAPVAVTGGLTFVSLSQGGGGVTCGLTASGAAYCWGDNSLGELGSGLPASSSVPVPVTGGLTFASISGGSLHTCALTPAGAAYCWGEDDGDLGDGTNTTNPVPSPVAVLGGLHFTSITAGFQVHTCALTLSGVAYCWGRNPEGELGDGTTTTRLTPTLVAQP